MKSYCSLKDLEGSREELVAWRHAIHENPELAFKETRTARMVADKLKAWGYAVTEGVGTTGVVGTLKAGKGSRSLGIRADMDALPILELTGLPYASKNEGVMHACGHDGHTTMLLGAARHLASTRNFYGLGHPVLVNAEQETELARQIAEELVGADNVVDRTEQVTGSEDFAYMLERVPGCFVRIGNGVGDNIPLLHTARYNFNDDNLTVGSAYWARLAERFLE